MVRLRLPVWLTVCCQTEISIPHGTIKTASRCHGRRSCRISIPHGTIKTYPNHGNRHHSVISIPHGTIKTDKEQVIVHPLLQISIPHGTIKTKIRYKMILPKILFQFHMVRLRRSIKCSEMDGR